MVQPITNGWPTCRASIAMVVAPFILIFELSLLSTTPKDVGAVLFICWSRISFTRARRSALAHSSGVKMLPSSSTSSCPSGQRSGLSGVASHSSRSMPASAATYCVSLPSMWVILCQDVLGSGGGHGAACVVDVRGVERAAPPQEAKLVLSAVREAGLAGVDDDRAGAVGIARGSPLFAAVKVGSACVG